MKKIIFLLAIFVFAAFGEDEDILSVSYDRYEYTGDSLVFYDVILEYTPSKKTISIFEDANVPMDCYVFICDIDEPDCSSETRAGEKLIELHGGGGLIYTLRSACGRKPSTIFPNDVLWYRMIFGGFKNCAKLDYFDVQLEYNFVYLLPNKERVTLKGVKPVRVSTATNISDSSSVNSVE